MAVRAERSFQEWLAHTQEAQNNEVLANVAAVQRWELTNSVEAVALVSPPPQAEQLHRQLQAALRSGARTTQLLSLGYRATNYSSVCDGQALWVDACVALRAVIEELSRWIENAPPLERPLASPTLQRQAS